MRKVKNFEAFNEGLEKVGNYLNDLIKKGGKMAADTWEVTKRESQETKIAVGILSKMLKGDEVSEKEKSFLKEQSKDLARIIPLIAVSGIPVPIPITPLLIMLGKKYGFDFMPRDHRGLLKDDEKTPPVEE